MYSTVQYSTCKAVQVLYTLYKHTKVENLFQKQLYSQSTRSPTKVTTYNVRTEIFSKVHVRKYESNLLPYTYFRKYDKDISFESTRSPTFVRKYGITCTTLYVYFRKYFRKYIRTNRTKVLPYFPTMYFRKYFRTSLFHMKVCILSSKVLYSCSTRPQYTYNQSVLYVIRKKPAKKRTCTCTRVQVLVTKNKKKHVQKGTREHPRAKPISFLE